jgi:hypothetical protein
MLKSLPYTIRQNVIKLGPGSTLSRVTLRYLYIPGEVGSSSLNMMYSVVHSEEFQRNLPLYRYWKLIGIKIIINPRVTQTTSNDLSGRITVDWDNEAIENILSDDSSKDIPSYSTRYRIYKFMPPDVMLTGLNGKRINYNNWISTNDDLQNAVPPGYIKISCNWDFNFSLEAMILWKGNQTSYTADTYKILNNQVIKMGKEEEKLELKEEEKEKEDKKEINENKEINEGKDINNILNGIKEQLKKIDL